MRAVNSFEASLLRILHCFLRRVPLEHALPLITREAPAPRCLSRDAVELIQDALAKGCTLAVARDGGWRQARFLRSDRIADGRLWERTPPAELGLTFSRHTIEFLIWITANKPTFGRTPALNRKPSTDQPVEPTVGDRLLFFLAYEALRDTELAVPLLQHPGFSTDGLLWLAFPDDFAESQIGARPNFASWILREGTILIEAFQTRLADRWVQIERRKQEITDWRKMNALGQAQEQALTGFLQPIDAAGHWDLARFLLIAAERILKESPRSWFPKLDVSGRRLAERADTHRMGVVFLHQLRELQAWDRRARTVGYLDEGYVQSQLWKSDWERWNGDALCDQARDIIGDIQPVTV